LQIIFHKRATKYRSLLPKMTYKDKGSCESSPPYMCEKTYSRVWHDSFTCVTWLIHTKHDSQAVVSGELCGDMTHLYMWHESSIFLTWLLQMCDMTHSHRTRFAGVNFWTYLVTWLILIPDMTGSHVWHDFCTCVTWLIHMYDITVTWLTGDNFWSYLVTWLGLICDMTYSRVWHDFLTCVTWLIHVYDMTHSYVTWLTGDNFWSHLVLIVCEVACCMFYSRSMMRELKRLVASGGTCHMVSMCVRVYMYTQMYK